MALPSVNTLETRLSITREEARTVRAILDRSWMKPSEALKAADEYLSGRGYAFYGVEYIAHREDWGNWRAMSGLEYLNAGDTYADTLIYDWARGTWRVCSWGDIVERRGSDYP